MIKRLVVRLASADKPINLASGQPHGYNGPHPEISLSSVKGRKMCKKPKTIFTRVIMTATAASRGPWLEPPSFVLCLHLSLSTLNHTDDLRRLPQALCYEEFRDVAAQLAGVFAFHYSALW